MMAYARRMLAKVAEFSFIFDNYIFLKVSRTCSKNPLRAYPTIISFHETISASCISKSLRASLL